MKNPIQPLEQKEGVLRFKANAIVAYLYELSSRHGCGLNELACMKFSNDDRQQFAQLLGYSLSGYGELGYVDDDSYGAAEEMVNGKTTEQARIAHLEEELSEVRRALRKPMARLFGIHPDDLTRNP